MCFCCTGEGLISAGATAEGWRDGAPPQRTADAGDGEGASVAGWGEAYRCAAAPPAAQRSG